MDIWRELFQRLALLIMRDIDSPKINELLLEKYLGLLGEVMRKKRGVEYIEDMLYYLPYKSEYLDRERTIERLSHYPETQNTREVVMTLAEQWKREGMSVSSSLQ